MKEEMFAEALTVRECAYAPYSGYKVGACIRSGEQLFPGCNVENVSFGGCICAERNAALRMVAEGFQEIDEVLVVTKDGGTPCGMCLQFMSEFAGPNTMVHLATPDKIVESLRFTELFPRGFASKNVAKPGATS